MDKIKRFARYYRPHFGLFLLDIGCASLVSAVDVGFPLLTNYIMKQLFPQFEQSGPVPHLVTLFIVLMVALLAAYLLRTAMLYIVNYWGHLLGVRIEADMRSDIFSHIQTLPFSFYDKIRTGKLLSRATTDLFDISELAHHGPEDFLISSLTIIGAFIAMFFVEWRIALAMLLIMPLCLLFVMRTRFNMKQTSKAVKEQVANINAGIESSISGARVAKAFANEEYEIAKFEEGNRQFLHAKDRFYRTMAIFNSGTDFFIALFNIVVLIVGGTLLIKQTGFRSITFITFMLYVSAFTSPLKRFAAFFEQYMMGMAGFTRFLEIMDTKSEIVDRPDAKELTAVEGKIELKDVGFSYNEGHPVLSHIDLTIDPGKTLALVGPSGGGKTTLCHLIMRFYDVTEGSICVDGTDIRDYTQESLRRNIGIVQQDVFLFAGSVLENIRYGRLDATDEEVVQAAIRAHIHDEIMAFPDQYQTEVGERGVKLSGGQKQRISIARLFLKNPRILILDEATSALDTVTEYDIQKSFDELTVGRTTLIIAHRLSTVRNANEIIVIDEQGIRERGTHEELLKQNGLYANFYQATLTE
ncbi:MAG: ABC transporter ATP-binding protein [Clostridia bacterium]|nr:ABC transporter ATP-binding protein [Clostridia bacterium]